MKRKIAQTIIILVISYLLLGLASFLIIYLLNKHYGFEFWNTLIITLSIEFLLFVLTTVFSLTKNTFIKLKNVRPYNYNSKYNNEKIRLSFAYLIRIKVNNRYLLVKSGHKRSLFGPVGGVYHIEHVDYVYNELGFSRDSTPGDEQDVRGTILGKNIKAFVKWFDCKKNRETNPDREYQEELLNSGILPSQLFDDPSFNFLGTKYKGISYSEFYQINELLRFDIYELVLNDDQIKYIENNVKKIKSITLFTREEIESLGITNDNDKRIIGTQTPYILED